MIADDKSFGQAANWKSIAEVGEQVRGYNSDFQGFVIQTPPSIANREGFLEAVKELGVGYIELGVETVNDEYLAKLNKPYRVRQLEQVSEKVRKLGLKIIPNFIMGIPGDDYKKTVKWVEENVDIIPVVNVNFLAVHHGNERGKLLLPSTTVGDRDQNTAEKSWLTPEDVVRMKEAMEAIYQLTAGI